jgi:hypothetical protein
VRESFELCLFAGKSPACAGAVFPAGGALLTALAVADSTAPGALQMRLDRLTAEACRTAAADEWICLAAFDATVTAPGSGQTVTDISVPDNAIAGRRPLLSTAALQALVLDLANVAGAAGALGTGPSVSGISFAGTGATAGTLTISIDLITEPPATTPTPLASGTFQPSMVQVHQFNSTTWAWDQVTPTTTGHISTDGTRITINWGTGDPALAAGNFRLSLVSPDATPIVDQHMRPLQPARFAHNFGLAITAGTLTLTAISV